MRMGSLAVAPAAEHGDLLAAPVAKALAGLADVLPASAVGVAEIDPELADTAAFCQQYGVALTESANCVVIAGRRDGEARYAACVILATTRADVNGLARRQLDVRKASFAPMADAVAQTGMEYGGITPVGLPAGWPVLVDAAVAAAPWVVMGSGLRRSKLILPGAALARLPGAVVLDGLAADRYGQPGHLAVQGGVADERHGVDQRMGDDHRRAAAPALIQDAEDNAHDRVSDECAETLVQVIGPAQHGAAHDGLPRRPAQLVQAAQQVGENHDLLEDAVVGGAEQQHRNAPPDGGQALGHHVEADPEVERGDVEEQAGRRR